MKQLENAEPTKKRIKLSGFIDFNPHEEVGTLQETTLTIKGQFETFNKKMISGGEDIVEEYTFTPDCTSFLLNDKEILGLPPKSKQIKIKANEPTQAGDGSRQTEV